MAQVIRIRSIWTGFQGAPGYTNMFFGPYDDTPSSASDWAVAVKEMWDVVKTWLPNGVTIQVQGAITTLDETTSVIVDEFNVSQPGASIGAGGSGFSAPAGACINWLTASFGQHGRIKGRSYVVPLWGGCYDTDGTLTSSVVSSLASAATALYSQTAPYGMVVYSRKRGTAAGHMSTVTSAAVPDKAVVLRSRRD